MLAMFIGLIWKNFYSVLVFVNGLYLNLKDWYLKNNFNYNSFKEISKETIINREKDDKKIVIYDYKFRGSDYKIICDEDKFSHQPYSVNYIDEKQNHDTLELIKNTKDDIISAELVMEDLNVDYHEEVQKLCGPLGDFYEDTVVEMKTENLLCYLKKSFSGHKIKKLNVMTSDGEEHNLLE